MLSAADGNRGSGRPPGGRGKRGKTGYILAEAIYGIGNLSLGGLSRIVYRRKKYPPKRIAIFRTGNLGDTFCAIPAIRALQKRYPNARCIILTSERRAGSPHPFDVLRGILSFDRQILFSVSRLRNPRYLTRLIKELRREDIDLLVYLGFSNRFFRIVRDLLFFRVGGCQTAVGFQWAWHGFFRAAQREHRSFDNEVRRLMKTVSPLGIDPEEIEWAIPPPATPRPLPERGGRTRIAVHPSAKFPVNQWPLERFGRLMKRLREEFDPQLVLVGAEGAGEGLPGNRNPAEAERMTDLRGETDYLELADVLRRCDLLISGDSGPVHVAAAVGTPVIGLYSARHYPGRWDPEGERHIILRRDVSCQVCFLTDCADRKCIRAISVEDVIGACRRILLSAEERV